MYLAGKIPVEDESFKGLLRKTLMLRTNVAQRTQLNRQNTGFVKIVDMVKGKSSVLGIDEAGSSFNNDGCKFYFNQTFDSV